MSTSPFDFAEFEKLRALIAAAPTPAEQSSSRLQARMMARAAGLTLAEAFAEADRAKEAAQQPEPAQPSSPMLQALAAVANTPEMRAGRAAREEARQIRRRELLEAYGSEEAVFAETEREAALRAVCEPLISPGSRPGLPSLLGWGPTGSRVDVPALVLETVSRAWPLPSTVGEAWAELADTERLYDDRQAVHPVEYHPPGWIEARRYVIEGLLDTLPASDLADVLVRISWMEHLNDRGFSRDIHEDAKLLAILRADLERLAVRSGQRSGEIAPEQERSPAIQSGQSEPVPPRTAGDRRRAVLALLADPVTAALSDREISRRAGVSPQTVGTWRKRVKEEPP